MSCGTCAKKTVVGASQAIHAPKVTGSLMSSDQLKTVLSCEGQPRCKAKATHVMQHPTDANYYYVACGRHAGMAQRQGARIVMESAKGFVIGNRNPYHSLNSYVSWPSSRTLIGLSSATGLDEQDLCAAYVSGVACAKRMGDVSAMTVRVKTQALFSFADDHGIDTAELSLFKIDLYSEEEAGFAAVYDLLKPTGKLETPAKPRSRL